MTQRQAKQTRIVCSELRELLPEGTLPDEVAVHSITLTGVQAAKIAAVFIGEARLTIQRLRKGRVAVRAAKAPTGLWWVFDADGEFGGKR
jgi:hypothetical protein